MKNVLVIGETIEDVFVYARKKGVSAETPTIVGYFERRETEYGGAANVVKNLQALGCVTTFLSNRDIIVFSKNPFQRNYQLVKERYFVDGYKLLQLDNIQPVEASDAERMSFRIRLKEEIKDVDVVVVSDYRHGMIDFKTAREITKLCRKFNKPLFVDSQVSQSSSNHRWYASPKETELVTYLMNEKEMELLVGKNASITDACEILRGKIVLKKGAQGCTVLTHRHANSRSYSAPKVEAVDTTGAGDCFLAALVATGSYSKANQWAALSVTYKGTKTPRMEDAKAATGFSLDR